MVLSEMRGDLPCADELFEASTAAEFAEVAANSVDTVLPPVPCVKDCISILLQESWSESERAVLPRTELRHLLILIFGLSSPSLPA